MLPLARFWTWIGTAYVPALASGIFYINNGPHRGVLISAGYLGLCASLAVGTILAVTLALYVMKARKSADPILAPPNTLFEDAEHRNRLISWGTVIVFALAILVGLIGFGNRYADSRIHLWDKTTPLADSFTASRAAAYAKGCPKGPCFAMGQRMEDKTPAEHVAEYVLYWTDGFLIFLCLSLLAALTFLARAFRQPHEPPKYTL
ncbi:MFS family permease [Bradyrhizobium huanghuaihaiense]